MSLTDAPTFGAWPGRSRLTPEGVRRQEFPRAPLGRRGYVESDVERFRARVADELARHDAEKAELRAEIDRLRNYFREQNIEPRRLREAEGPDLSVFAEGGTDEHRWFARGDGTVEDPRELRRRRREQPPAPPQDAWAAAVAADPWGTGPIQQPFQPPALPPAHQDPAGGPPSVQAVNVLSQAQQAADQHIAQAEDSARQLIRTARAQYERILLEAHQKAEDAAQQAARAYDEATAMQAQAGAGAGSAEELQRLQERMSYLKTFAEISRVQMRSVLEALGAELDRLTDGLDPAALPSAEGGPPAAGPATGGSPYADDRSPAAGQAGPVTQPTHTLDLRALESRAGQ
jgi:DivIVA domain-containing protein